MTGIYIHIPFCKQACHYCDFHFSTSLKKKDELIQALIVELELRKEELKGQIVETIYFGGGTPSLLSVFELKQIIDAVYDNYIVTADPEITLEANPDDLLVSSENSNSHKSLFEEYRNIGINRLSIGIQSFYEEDLKLMNRAHNAEEAKKCLAEATTYFENITIDLIYGIPGLSHTRWIENIETALAFNLPHISSYALTVEPKTALAKFIQKGVIDNVDDEMAQEQYNMLCDRLEREGFINYELSNFGKPGFFSKNNTSYWQGKPYLGIGPSAHSFDGVRRGWNVRNNSIYINKLSKRILPIEIETLTLEDRYNEYIMTGLRTIWGVSMEKVQAEFGAKYETYLNAQSQKYISEQLLYLENGKLLVTKKGKFLTDGIAADLFKINSI